MQRWFRPASQEQANFQCLVLDIFWFGLALATTSRFLQVYAIRLGATSEELNWIVALPALVLAISTGFGAFWMKRYKNAVRSTFLPGLGFRLVFLLPAFTPFLPAQWQFPWLIASVVLPAIPQGAAAVSFLIMLRQAVEAGRLTDLMSQRSLALNVTLAISTIVCGFWLESFVFPLNYQIMFLAGFVLSLISLWFVVKVKVEDLPLIPKNTLPRINPWRDPAFQRVVLVGGIIHVVYFAVDPALNMRIVRDLDAPDAFMGVFGFLELAAGALTALYGSRLIKRLGTNRAIEISLFGMALSALIAAFAPQLYVTLLAAVLRGSAWTLCATIALWSYFFEHTPVQHSGIYTQPYHQVLAFGMFLGPLAAIIISTAGLNTVSVLIIGAVARAAVGVWLHFTAQKEIVHAPAAAGD